MIKSSSKELWRNMGAIVPPHKQSLHQNAALYIALTPLFHTLVTLPMLTESCGFLDLWTGEHIFGAEIIDHVKSSSAVEGIEIVAVGRFTAWIGGLDERSPRVDESKLRSNHVIAVIHGRI